MTPRRGEYGFDAPYVPALMLVGSLPLWWGALSALRHGDAVGVATMGSSAAFLFFCAASYVYTTRRGKFEAWQRELSALSLRGDEALLDLGCGRGAVLLLAAARLPRGRATGIDLWQVKDQSGNALDATRRNAEAEGVAGRVELHTGDMRALPFQDGAFDVVTSSLALHNIPDAAGRGTAVREAWRVLKPGGCLVLADFRFTGDYAEALEAAGATEVQVKSLGLRFWYGGPWAATRAVLAQKPGN